MTSGGVLTKSTLRFNFRRGLFFFTMDDGVVRPLASVWLAHFCAATMSILGALGDTGLALLVDGLRKSTTSSLSLKFFTASSRSTGSAAVSWEAEPAFFDPKRQRSLLSRRETPWGLLPKSSVMLGGDLIGEGVGRRRRRRGGSMERRLSGGIARACGPSCSWQMGSCGTAVLAPPVCVNRRAKIKCWAGYLLRSGVSCVAVPE